MTRRNQRSFNLDERGVTSTKSVLFAMAGVVVLAGVTAGVATDRMGKTAETEKVLKSEIEVISQDKVRVTPLVGNPLPTKHLRVHVTFPEQNKSGITVENLKGAAGKTQVATQTVTENVTVGVKQKPIYKNVSIPGVGLRKKLDHYVERPIKRNVTRKKTAYRFEVDEWHNNSGGEEDSVESIGDDDDTSFFSSIPGLGNGKKKTLASNVVSGVGGSFNADNPRMWSAGESFIVDLRDDIINEGDVVRVQVYDARSEKRVLNKAARAQGLPYTGFEFGEEESSDGDLKTKPTAKIFGPNTTIPNKEVTFILEANDVDGTIEEIIWSNGEKGPTADYSFTESPGAYVGVSATVIDDDGNTTGAKHTVRIVEPPNIGPEVSIDGPTSVEFGDVRSYTADATDSDGQITNIEWSTGDSGPQSSVSFFQGAGSTRTISVSVTDNDGATTTASRTVRINPVDDGYSGGNQDPEVSISGPSRVDLGDSARYTVSASDPDGSVRDIEWNNGGSGTSENIEIDGVVGETDTVSVTVTDNDGGTTTATKTVRITEPPLSATILGPSKVQSGSSASFSVTASERITRVEWEKTSPAAGTATGTGDSASFYFSAHPGDTATISAQVTDRDGDTVSISKTVDVVPGAEPPEVEDIYVNTGQEGRCLPPDKPSTIRVVANDPDPSGRIDSVRWFDQMHTNPIGFGQSISYTPDVAPGEQAKIAAKVWDNSGKSTTEVLSRLVCQRQADSDPSIDLMKATNPDPDQSSATDYFDSPAGFTNKLFRFTANANDDNDDILTYVWKFPNGDVKKTEGRASVVPYAFSGSLNEGDSRSVTLLVTDSSGNTVTKTETINWEQDTTTRYSSWVPDFEVSPSYPKPGETVTLAYTPSRNRDGPVEPPMKDVSVRVSWGDGTTDTVQGHDYDRALDLRHQYENGGDYTIQIYPLDRDGNLIGGSHVTSVDISVQGGSYKVYKYKSEVVSEETVAASPPSDLWTKKEFHHSESELISEETQDIKASNNFRKEQLLMAGWETDGSHYEAVHVGYYEQSDWQSPGSDWFKVEDDIGTTSVRDGWSYEVYEDKQDDSGHVIDGGTPGTYVGKVKDYYETTKTTESTSSPGYEWSRGDHVGTTRTGWDYYWRDNEYSGWSSPTLVDTRQDKIESRTTDTSYKCENYITGSTSWSGSPCGPYETQVATDTDVDPAEYDTDYQYREGEYDDVYEWHKTVTRYEYDYKYKFKDYRQETLHLWNKDKYEDQLFLDMRKAKYNTTLYYVYEKSGVTQEYSLTRPPESAVVDGVREVRHRCTNPEAPLNEKAC